VRPVAVDGLDRLDHARLAILHLGELPRLVGAQFANLSMPWRARYRAPSRRRGRAGHARRLECRLDAVAADIRGLGGAVAALRTDVSKRTEAQALISAAVEAFGGLDVCVNNAGVGL
jgi:NAD(P)-dependent dehydrogenase (short-subunit alcohol dehydrogenase family)